MPDGIEVPDIPNYAGDLDLAAGVVERIEAYAPEPLQRWHGRPQRELQEVLDAWRSGEGLAPDVESEIRRWRDWQHERARTRQRNLASLSLLLRVACNLAPHREEPSAEAMFKLIVGRTLHGRWKLAWDSLEAALRAPRDVRGSVEAFGLSRPWEVGS